MAEVGPAESAGLKGHAEGGIDRSVRLLALQLGIFVALGLPDGALGVAWPGMRGSFRRPTADLGLVLMAATAGYLVGGVSTGQLVRRAGTGRLAWATTLLAAVALVGQAGTRVWAVFLLASLVLGLARGSTDAALNGYFATHAGVRQLGLLHASYGVGTTAAPLVATALLGAGWRWGWLVLASLTGLLALWAWWPRDSWPGDQWEPVRPVAGARISSLPFILTLITFAAYVGAEFATASWAFILLTETRAMSRGAAGLAVASFWAALTCGRLLLWRAGDRLPNVMILHVSCAVAASGLGWLWLNPAGAGWVGLPAAGLGMAAVFPTLVALTPERVGSERAASTIGWSVASASLGGAGLSALTGLLPIAPTLAAYGMVLFASHALLTAATT